MDADTLQELAKRDAQIVELRLELINRRLKEAEDTDEDHEQRIRTVEAASTEFRTLAWIAFGGGGAGIVTLILRLTGN